MSSTHKQMFEGVGAPVDVTQTEGRHIDPTLDSCCQREIESNRKRDAVETQLRAHDRVSRAVADRRRQRPGGVPSHFPVGGECDSSFANLLRGMTFGSGCRCCYDPAGDGGEYELLAEKRREGGGARGGTGGDVDAGEEDADGIGCDEDSDDDSDSDSEFDYLLDEDVPGGASSGYDDLQAHRRAELENTARRAEAARHHGYGVHRQMHPRRVFAAVGYGVDHIRDLIRPEGAVLHLHDPHSPLSASLDLCLEGMAMRFPGTKFVRGAGVASLPHAEGGDAGWKRGDLPAVLAFRRGEVVAWSSGLRDFYRGRGSGDAVESKVVEQWLDRAGVLIAAPPPLDVMCNIRPEEEALLENMRKLNGLGGGSAFGGMMGLMKGEKAPGSEDLEEDGYECGVTGCCKSFYHEHVGVKNEAQDGLLVAESQVASSVAETH